MSGNGAVEPLEGAKGAPDETTVRAIVAAVEAALARRRATRSAPDERRPAHRLWRFSGRSWARPAPLSRERPLR